MTDPYWEADGIRLFLGDAREVMLSLPAESVSCIMTSPPFWGLRSYSCEPSIWGGDPNCPHRLEAGAIDGEAYTGRFRWQHMANTGQKRDSIAPTYSARTERPDAWAVNKLGETVTCSLCGCWRGQLGLEPTVGAYIEHTMEWLREAKRVLRKDGVAWLDIGDSRGGSGNAGGENKTKGKVFRPEGLPRKMVQQPKSLCLIPQRIAIACQDGGWIVRSVIVIPSWMPESAKDRPTDSYRTVLMLVKNNKPLYYWNEHTGRMADRPPVERVEGVDWEWQIKHKAGQLWGSRKHSFWHGEDYWYDAQAVRQPMAQSSLARISQPGLDGQRGGDKQLAYEGSGNANRAADMVRSLVDNDGTKNLPDIWDIPPAAYPDTHFATFATEEPELAIRASCPEAICVKCGKPRMRIVKAVGPTPREKGNNRGWSEGRKDIPGQAVQGLDYAGGHGSNLREVNTVGWSDCGCGAGWESGICLDPFIGTGTTAVAARMLGRRAIGIDASEDYLRQAVTRLTVGDSGIRRIVAARRQGAEQRSLW